jgi:hypothetical protein
VKRLLSGQRPGGGFGVHPYQKWTGAHWRLVSLAELAIPEQDPRALKAADDVLGWLLSDGHRSGIKTINGRVRRHASQEGNALAACSRIGLAGDPRVRRLAISLIAWQWPDGGWNCDARETAHHSSFYESLSPLWGLIEYHRATGDRRTLAAARRAAELILKHRVFRSDRDGRIINKAWLTLHYPLYWHYDILQALLVLSRLGPLNDPRAMESLDILEARRRRDGRWQPGAYFWSLPEKNRSGMEIVDWGRGGPNEMLTLNGLRVLKAAGRFHAAAASR